MELFARRNNWPTTPVPASPLLLCRYVAFLSRRLKYSSLKQYLNIVGLLYKEWGMASPLDSYQLRLTLRGARRVLGDVVCRKEPFTPHLLCCLLRGLDITLPRQAAVWPAALCSLFFGLLRRSNVIPPSAALFDLRREDLSLTRRGPRSQYAGLRWTSIAPGRGCSPTLALGDTRWCSRRSSMPYD